MARDWMVVGGGVVALGVMLVSAALVVLPVANAAIDLTTAAPATQNLSGLGGVDSAGAVTGGCSDSSYTTQATCEGASETWTAPVAAVSASGWYEIQDLVAPGLIVAISVVVAFVGFHMVRRLIYKIR